MYNTAVIILFKPGPKQGPYGEEFHFEVDQLYAVKVGFVVNVIYCFHVGSNLQNILVR